MDRETAIRCIKNGRYEKAANHFTKMIMREKIHTQRRRRQLTTEQIAEILRTRYLRIKDVNNGRSLEEKAEQVYDDFSEEYVPPELQI